MHTLILWRKQIQCFSKIIIKLYGGYGQMAFTVYTHLQLSQEELNRNDMMSLIWDTGNDNIKCQISAFGSIKLERKKGGEIFCAFKMEILVFAFIRTPSLSCINIRNVFGTLYHF